MIHAQTAMRTNGRNGHGPAGLERPTAYNTEAEEAVLGAMLIDRDAVSKATQYLTRPDHFYHAGNGHVFAALCRLADRGEVIDTLTVHDELERMGRLDAVGGPARVNELVLAVPTALHVEHYAKIVKRTAVHRQLLQAAEQIAQLPYNHPDEEIDTLFAMAEGYLYDVEIEGVHNQLHSLEEALYIEHDHYEKVADGAAMDGIISTGFVDLDRTVGGLEPGDLIIIAAPPSTGKTALAVTMLDLIAIDKGHPSLAFSVEMRLSQMVRRLMVQRTGIEYRRLRQGPLSDSEQLQIARVIEQVKRRPLWIDDTPVQSIASMRNRLKLHTARNPLSLVVLDYAQKLDHNLHGRNENTVNEYLAVQLKGLAREFEVPLIALSRVNKLHGKRPKMDDIPYVGFDYEADVIIFMHPYETGNLMELIVAKNRNDAKGSIDLTFVKEKMRFADPTGLDDETMWADKSDPDAHVNDMIF